LGLPFELDLILGLGEVKISDFNLGEQKGYFANSLTHIPRSFIFWHAPYLI